MSKREEFTAALKDAMKAKDEVTVGTLRLVLAALKDKDIAARTDGKTMGEPEILSMLQGMIKQRQESADTYQKAGRPELAARENAEIAVIQRFMPAQLGDDEIRTLIARLIAETGAAGIKDMGKVMGALKSGYAGQLDMAKAGAVVRERLAG